MLYFPTNATCCWSNTKLVFLEKKHNSLWMRINFFDGVMPHRNPIWEFLSNKKALQTKPKTQYSKDYIRQRSSISLIFPWFLIHFLWLSTARKCPSEGCCMFCSCSHLHILLLTRKMQQPAKGTVYTMYSCSVLIGNTTQFKSHNDSQNLWLYFVKTTIQRESISRNAGKKNNKYCHTCTAVWNTETLISVTRSNRKITYGNHC